MVTIEDLFEEIIGEFQDEFDTERAWLQLRPGNQVIVRGDVHVEDLNEWLGLNLPTDAADTVGGLIFGMLGKLPSVGDVVPLSVSVAEKPESTEYATEHAEATNTTALEVTEPDVVARVERMYRNSVAEVSIQVSPEQADKLHERVKVV
jgi:Mg2+/Co2+ transporter CorC